MIHDVTKTLSPALPVWPGDPLITREPLGGDVRLTRWTLGSHAGTHVDAPAHYLPNGATVDELDPAILLGLCRVISLPDPPIVTAGHLPEEALAGVERLLLRTANSARDPGAFHADFIALDLFAAQLLIARGIKLIGIDGPSIESFDGDGSVHRLLLSAGVILVENLDLSAISPGDYRLICAPLPLQGSDGAPARVFLQDIG